ncbi:hypothetical protein [Nitrospira sp. M1]
MNKTLTNLMTQQKRSKGKLFQKTQKACARLSPLLAIVFCMVGTVGCGDGNVESTNNPTNVTLKLSGNNCELYLGAVGTALQSLEGVQEMDLTTQKGQAIIKTDGTVKASHIVDTVDGLSGDGWECEAELMNEKPI